MSAIRLQKVDSTVANTPISLVRRDIWQKVASGRKYIKIMVNNCPIRGYNDRTLPKLPESPQNNRHLNTKSLGKNVVASLPTSVHNRPF